ncbi:MAG TPA: chemotaxis protein CheX [Candidatus Saccharimonadales bacterium]|nr:chemotaxis protein CheX [Candidatus Saccharimonadales bacterium]
MPPEISRELLARVVGQTLEEAAFVFTEATDAPPSYPGVVLEARMQYAGPGRGEVRLAASPEVAVDLAANLLGEDPASPEAQERQADAVAELLNICCGALAREVFGPVEVCELSVPEVRRLAAAEFEDQAGRATCRVSLLTEEGGRLDAAVFPARGTRVA